MRTNGPIYVIGRCVKVKPSKEENAVILTDSEAAVKILSSYQTSSKLVLKCFNNLKTKENFDTPGFRPYWVKRQTEKQKRRYVDLNPFVILGKDS